MTSNIRARSNQFTIINPLKERKKKEATLQIWKRTVAFLVATVMDSTPTLFILHQNFRSVLRNRQPAFKGT
jgi:hypothetical protein